MSTIQLVYDRSHNRFKMVRTSGEWAWCGRTGHLIKLVKDDDDSVMKIVNESTGARVRLDKFLKQVSFHAADFKDRVILNVCILPKQ